MIYCFDIDGVICNNTYGKYEEAEPNHAVIAFINHLYDQGNMIRLHTARGSFTGTDWYTFTMQQMKDWGLKFHKLYMGKPYAEVYVDDRAINFNAWWLEKTGGE